MLVTLVQQLHCMDNYVQMELKIDLPIPPTGGLRILNVQGEAVTIWRVTYDTNNREVVCDLKSHPPLSRRNYDLTIARLRMQGWLPRQPK